MSKDAIWEIECEEMEHQKQDHEMFHKRWKYYFYLYLIIFVIILFEGEGEWVRVVEDECNEDVLSPPTRSLTLNSLPYLDKLQFCIVNMYNGHV